MLHRVLPGLLAALAALAAPAAARPATLAEAVRQGRGHAVYPCGFGLSWSATADTLALWSRLMEAVRSGERYTHATIERVFAAAGP